MNITLTGGSGFLGGYLIAALRNSGHTIDALTRRPDDQPAMQGVRWVAGDLSNGDWIDAVIDHSDGIIHAALDRPRPSFMDHPIDPVAYFNTNVVGSLRLMDAAAAAKVNRFVFVSSGAVHAEVLGDRTLDETHPLRPNSLYGSAKASVETLVHAYGLADRLSVCTLRPPTIYGKAEPVQASRWFELIQSVVHGKKVHATGGGKCVHAADVASAALRLIETDHSVSGQTFNCCDQLISEFDVAILAKEIARSNAVIEGTRKQNRNPMSSDKLRSLGHCFGGDQRLRDTIQEIIDAIH